MTTIPASLFVAVTPSVLPAGGEQLDVVTLVGTSSNRVPLGAVYSFALGSAVTSFFGSGSAEDVVANGGAGKGSGYFGGFTGADRIPGALLFAQYNQAAVAAYLWGGNVGAALTLAQLKALSGTLSITIDGTPKSGSVNLSGATSFTNAAEIIAADLAIEGVSAGTVTGSQGGTATTCTTTGTTLTLGALATGKFQVGDTVTANDGTNTLNTTIVAQLTGTPGGSAGATYTVAAAATPGDLTSSTVTAKGATLTVTALGTATAVNPGDVAAGTNIPANTYVVGQVTPLISGEATGGIGRYTVSNAVTTVAASETITLYTPAVQFDSLSGAFVVYSGTTGSPTSTMAFATGTIAAGLLLTQATGAFLSQGAAAATPASFMNGVVAVTTNFVCYKTSFDPDGGSGNTLKQAFAAWKNAYPNRYAYVVGDVDPLAVANPPQTETLGYVLANNGDSGTFLISETAGSNVGSFVCGAAASIDFEETNGRITFAFKNQPGLVASVVTATQAVNAGGNPQVEGSFGNGYNYFGAVGGAAQNFLWLQRGTVTGPFKWFDSYVNQVWWNNLLQNALLNFLGTVKSVPFNQAGAGLIEQVLADPIQAGLNFGAAAPGSISSAQVAEVNTAAGANVATTLQTQGYYLQVLQQSATVRGNRGPWAITLWYLDRGSVQSISLSSIAVE